MIIHFSESTSAPYNLATEEFLFTEKKENILFLYVNEPSVIIGCNQVLSNEVNSRYCTENNLKIMRRLSGGGAVYHDTGNLNYCFISNRQDGISAIESDFLTNVILVLHQLNIPVHIGKRKDLYLPGEFKISGTASHVTRQRQLHHGTLLYDSDLSALQQALLVKEKDVTKKGIASVPSPVKNIKTYLIENNLVAPTATEFFYEIPKQFEKLYPSVSELHLTTDDCSRIQQYCHEKYETKEWIWKK